MPMTRKTQRAITRYGEAACRKAYEMHREGFGAAGVAAEGFPSIIRTTQQADAAINAGRELEELGPLCICQNCEREWYESDLDFIDDVFERISPGELMPNGQCPDETCAAVCHDKNGPAYKENR